MKLGGIEIKLEGIDYASKYWNIPKTTLKRMCREGRVESEKIGGRWLIDMMQENPRESVK